MGNFIRTPSLDDKSKPFLYVIQPVCEGGEDDCNEIEKEWRGKIHFIQTCIKSNFARSNKQVQKIEKNLKISISTF